MGDDVKDVRHAEEVRHVAELVDRARIRMLMTMTESGKRNGSVTSNRTHADHGGPQLCPSTPPITTFQGRMVHEVTKPLRT